MKTTTSRALHYAGLDGLRAIAVALVVVYHLFPGWRLQSGFIGVDVFFVISGFLITSLLLREHEATGGIRLIEFWRRRARRLLPALGVLVTVCATAAWFVGGDVLVGLAGQIVGAATFSYNWISIAGGADYFSSTAPELFQNLWSLAVEEQFYVLWPLVLPLFLLARRRVTRIAVASALALGSAVWATALASSGVDITRVYFGTDTHAFGLLLGVALAFAARGTFDRPPLPITPAVVLSGGWSVVPDPRLRQPWMYRRSTRVITGIAGAAAVLALIALALVTPTADAFTYPGQLVAASVLTAIAIASGIWPGSWFGRAIDVAALRWIGARSYGIYLWHWPLVVLIAYGATGQAPSPTMPVMLGLAALLLTLVAAELSFRFVETPIRRLGFRGSMRALGSRLSSSPTRRFGAVAGVLVGVLALGGTTAALASAPEETTSESVIEAGQAALDAAQATDAADEAGSADGDAGEPDGADAGGEPDGSDAGAAPGAREPGGADGAAREPDGADTGGVPDGSDAGAGTPGGPDAGSDAGASIDGTLSPGGSANGARADGAQTDTLPGDAAPTGPAPTRTAPPGPPRQPPLVGVPLATPVPISGDQISAIGDSVMLASAPALLERFPGVQIDAEVSRSMWAGVSIAQTLADQGALRPYLVVALGTNGPVDRAALEKLATIAGPDRELVLVNASAPRDWIDGVNQELLAFADSRSRVAVADWGTAIAAHADLLAGDGIHPGTAGGKVYAQTLSETLDRVAVERAARQDRTELQAWGATLDDPLPTHARR